MQALCIDRTLAGDTAAGPMATCGVMPLCTTPPGSLALSVRISAAHVSALRRFLVSKPHLTGAIRRPAHGGLTRDWATICLLLMYIFYLAGRTQFYACAAYF